MGHAKRMVRIFIRGLSGSIMVFHIVSQIAGFSMEKIIEHKMCHFFVSKTLSEVFLILIRIQ
jgi:hypothetical protein